ncbi:LamG-like jellyroll fold domain-containing protein [Hymenobacter sp. B81]|uniref:LamG domain-containing protein n=1 Tax=Hymenobacter sp. B81 TaxID=3344878 RepID=UPI0037DC49AA
MNSTLRKAGLLALLGTGLSFSSHAQLGGRALSFNNTRQHKVSVPLAAPTGSFTLESWVYFIGASFSDGGSHNTILEFGNDDIWFGVTFGGQLSVYQVLSDGNVPTNTWAHVAYSWDGTTGRLYLNGTQIAANTTPPAPGGQNLGIGYNVGDTSWNGYLDEVMVWNVARSASQIQADRQNGAAASAPGLVAYFKFDEASGQAVLNQVPGGVDGVLGSTAGVDVNDPARTVVTSARALRTASAVRLMNYPNPFQQHTTISYTLERPAAVRLTVLDATGRLVATLVDAPGVAGPHQVPFRAALPAGLYRCQLSVDGQTTSQAMLVQP